MATVKLYSSLRHSEPEMLLRAAASPEQCTNFRTNSPASGMHLGSVEPSE
jgi:hypothetical protein